MKGSLTPENNIQQGRSAPRPKLIFFVTEDWYFFSHRIALAEAAADYGFDVAVVTRVDRHGELIADRGIRVIPVSLRRSGINPFKELHFI